MGWRQILLGVGVGIGIGIDSARGMHERNSSVFWCGRPSFSFDSDTDSDTDPDSGTSQESSVSQMAIYVTFAREKNTL